MNAPDEWKDYIDHVDAKANGGWQKYIHLVCRQDAEGVRNFDAEVRFSHAWDAWEVIVTFEKLVGGLDD